MRRVRVGRLWRAFGRKPPCFVHGDASELFGSGARLKAHYLDGGGGARELLYFHDSELGIDCTFVETKINANHSSWNLRDGAECNLLPDANGQVRCVHDALLIGPYPLFYSDASCTERVQAQGDAACSSPIQYLVEGDFGLCKTVFTQAYVANAYSGPVYSMQSGSCESDTDEQSYYRFFTAGAPVSAEAFPAIAETTDP